MVEEKNWPVTKPLNWDYDAIHRSILSGYLSNIAVRQKNKLYQGTKNRELLIFPGSGVYKNKLDWIVAIEIIETSRLFAHRVAGINPDWLEALGGNLCKKQWFEPHFDPETSRVIAWEKVTLFGFTIVEKRQVDYGKINLSEATDIFIREALVEQKLKCELPFWKHNCRLIQEIIDLENKTRKRNLLIDDYSMEKCYQERIVDRSSLTDLKKLIKEKNGDGFLYLSRDELMRSENGNRKELYPDNLTIGGKKCRLTYQFEPDHPQDGVTVYLPWTLKNSLKQESFDYLVPGLLREKILYLLKNLPKELRRKIFPLQDIADRIWDAMIADVYSTADSNTIEPEYQKFNQDLSNTLFKIARVDCPAETWQQIHLPPYLKMNFSVKEPESGNTYESRILAEIQDGQSERKDDWLKLIRPYIRKQITKWDFGDLLEAVNLNDQGDISIWGYRTLKASDSQLTITLSKTKHEAENHSIKGIAVLMENELSDIMNWLYHELRFPPETINQFETLWNSHRERSISLEQNRLKVKRSKIKKEIHQKIQDQSYHMVRRSLFEFNDQSTWTRNAYKKRLERLKNELKGLGPRLVDWIRSTMAFHEQIQVQLQIHQRQLFYRNLEKELKLFFPPDCLDVIPLEQWSHCPRLMRAYLRRMEKYRQDPYSENNRSESIRHYFRLCQDIKKRFDMTYIRHNWAFRHLLWMFEEYKVSVFAQDLKTAFPVSEKRLNRFIEKYFDKKSEID